MLPYLLLNSLFLYCFPSYVQWKGVDCGCRCHAVLFFGDILLRVPFMVPTFSTLSFAKAHASGSPTTFQPLDNTFGGNLLLTWRGLQIESCDCCISSPSSCAFSITLG
ncbi:hypothetical protein P3L10_030650 [Capsicum annuum]